MVEEKIVPFQRNSVSSPLCTSEARKLGDTCRKLTLAFLKDLLQQMFDTADDTLFKLAGASGNDSDQGLYFDSMRIIRFKRDAIEEAFFNEVSDVFRDFWISTPHDESGEYIIPDELRLVDEQDLEEDLAIKNLIRKIRSNFQQDISAIEKRLSEIVTNKKIDARNNPIGPETFCKAFQFAARELSADIKIKLILFKLLDFHISGNIGAHYQKINELFISAGVLPQLKLKIKNKNTATSPSGYQGNTSRTQDTGSYPEAWVNGMLSAFQQLRQQPAPGHRTQVLADSTNPLAAFQHNSGAGGVLTSDILAANLTPLQTQFQGDAVAYSVDAVTQQIKKAIISGNSAQKVSPVDSDIIDLVSMLFEFVLDDQHIPATARSAIARLQIPIIKAAILDKEFFNINGHPARKLLNTLAHAGLDLPTEDDVKEHPLHVAIQHAVNRIIHEFKNNLDIFSTVLGEFEQSIESIRLENIRLTDESLQPFYKKEEYRLAEQWVTDAIQTQIDSKSLPEPFTSLILGPWKNVMLDTYLNEGQQSNRWKNQQRFIDILCWSIEPKFITQDRKKLGNILRFIIETLNNGLSQISTPAEAIAQITLALEPYHYASLHGKLMEENEDYVNGVFQKNIHEESLASSIEQLQAAISGLPDIDITSEDDSNGDKQLMENIILEGFVDTATDADFPADEYLELARHLEAGKWVEFTNETQQKTRARLAWKSDLLGEFTFLNWKFDVIADKKLFELASDFRQGKARVIDDLPLIDRAFSAIMNTLQGKTASA